MSPDVKETTVLRLGLGVLLLVVWIWSALTETKMDPQQAMDKNRYDDCLISLSKNKNTEEKQTIATACLNQKELYKETYGIEPN